MSLTMRMGDPAGNFHQLLMADRHGSEADRKRGYDRIRAMSYDRFLATWYWQVIRDYVLHLAKHLCHHCGRHATQVHHLTYQNHGAEHLHLGDLAAVCKDCHKITHTDGELPARRVRAMEHSELVKFREEIERARRKIEG